MNHKQLNDMKMYKMIVFTIISLVAVMMGSCGNGSQKVPFDDGDSAEVANLDPTVYGICGVATSMNSLQLITDTGDTLIIDLSTAQEDEKILGGLQPGDRMAVIPTSDKKEALVVINQTSLLGNWVMPNPIDGSDEIGIRIKEGGIVEGIDQSSIIYKTWRLVRGHLEIVTVREGGSEEDETNLYEIVKLGADSLVFKDSEDTFEYSRQKPRETYGLDIELEESTDDFKM